MLTHLRIQNYAVVEDQETVFTPGLNVITGETGAGKSIVIGSIGLITGEPASAEIIRKGAAKTVVEGVFTLPDNSILTEAGEELDAGSSECIIRREVADSGRSRAFINDTPVRLSTLKTVTQRLLDLHGQHQHQSLLHPETYHALVDSFGGLQAQAAGVAGGWRELKHLENALKDTRRSLEQARKDSELAKFQLSEIDRYNPQPDEDMHLEQEIRLASSMEKILQAAAGGIDRLIERDDSAGAAIRQTLAEIDPLSSVDPRMEEIRLLLESAATAVEESAAALQKFSAIEEFSPEMLEQSRSRLSELATLKRKYHRSLEDLLQWKTTLLADASRVDELDRACAELEQQTLRARDAFAAACAALSQERAGVAKRMGPAVARGLKTLGMEGSRFQVDVKRRTGGTLMVDGAACTADDCGIDDIEFLIATNKGEDMKPLARIASGGEISRVMLAIKTALATHDRIPILVFDEIDIGISGRIARVVGEQLRALAQYHQILCVTHLPQIAGLGHSHYVASKETRGNRVFSNLRRLQEQDRLQEIARLIGGDRVTPAALQSAKEMMEQSS